MTTRRARATPFVLLAALVCTAAAQSDDQGFDKGFLAAVNQMQASRPGQTFPYCAWWQEISMLPDALNWAYPDQSARYWVAPYLWSPDLKIVLRGTFPPARYISVQSYDASRQPYFFDGCQFQMPARLTDFQLYRDAGSPLNPFRPIIDPNATAGPGACPADLDDVGGTYTLTLTADLLGPAPNTLPLGKADAVEGQETYLLIFRVYYPPDDFELPEMDLVLPNGTIPLPLCEPGEFNLSKIYPASGVVAKDGQAERGTWSRIPPAGIFPNQDTGYITNFLEPADLQSKLFVTSLLPPTSPRGAGPVVWPDERFQVRFFDVCLGGQQAPLPTYSCLDDTVLKPDNASSPHLTIVLSTPANRPPNAANWLSTNLEEYPEEEEVLIMRNMLCADDYEYCTTKVPTDSSAASAASVLGPHYPRSAWCDPQLFAKGRTDWESAELCFQAAGV